jgi:carboxypeptidase PM20D1
MRILEGRRRIIVFVVLVTSAAVVVFCVNAALLADRQVVPSKGVASPVDDLEKLVEHFREGVKCQTVVPLREDVESEKAFQKRVTDSDAEFDKLHGKLAQWFPLVYSKLTPKRPANNKNSLYFRWEGSRLELPPAVLTSHLDVVPASPAGWTYDPFIGMYDPPYIWGRGTLDDKVGVLGILEAAERLLQENSDRPVRTIYFAFGATEEVGGSGAPSIVQEITAERKAELKRLLKKVPEDERDLFECVVDEGTAVVRNMISGLKKASFAAAIAPIGVIEKGYVDIVLTVRQAGGHSSVAPPRTANGILSRAIDRLDRSPFPSYITPLTKETLETLGARMSFDKRIVFANLIYFDLPVRYALAASPELNAMIRTTGATTVFLGGDKSNVLPEKAQATINYRILPDDPVLEPDANDPSIKTLSNEPKEKLRKREAAIIEKLRSRVEQIVGDDRVSVTVHPVNRFAPSQRSSTRTPSYKILQQVITDVFESSEHVIVIPFLVTAGTDARFYEDVCRNVYRFLPVVLEPDDLKRIHGVDERISAEDYRKAVFFYRQLISALTREFDQEGAQRASR